MFYFLFHHQNTRCFNLTHLTHLWPIFPFETRGNTKNQRFSGLFRGHKMVTLARNGLRPVFKSYRNQSNWLVPVRVGYCSQMRYIHLCTEYRESLALCCAGLILHSPKITEKQRSLTLEAPTPQNSQTHSNNSSAAADELFECVSPFYWVGA